MNKYLFMCFCSIVLFSFNVNAQNPSQKDKHTVKSSTFFSTVFIEQTAYDTKSDGDLWPSAWSDDDFLYSANGDGKGFDLKGQWSDIVVNRIQGHPDHSNIQGTRLSSGDSVGKVWSDTSSYNRKPTGMVSDGGVLYLAVQDLNKRHPNKFDDAPTATILRSVDKGKTWRWNKSSPMFNNHIFTTIMFLDYGKDNQDNIFDNYIYAYGIDYNWRDSYSDNVPDPDKLYLARIPRNGLQDLDTWQFYTGDLEGTASWSAPGDISEKKPVLQDGRRRYRKILIESNPSNMSVISQGSIVYNKHLDRYIYASWTSLTHEFYEAPKPWGPWKLFLSKDYGPYPWNATNYGGYAPVIPSKFISHDGKEMWVSTSTFIGGVHHYNFSLRRLWVSKFEPSVPTNLPGNNNLASLSSFPDIAPISATCIRGGNLQLMNDGRIGDESNLDSRCTEFKSEDYWGYTWPKSYNMNQLIYTTGIINKEGGWFEDLRVQVRKNFEWIDVTLIPPMPVYGQAKTNEQYILNFENVTGDGIRIIGKPGGKMKYTSIAELEVYYEPR